MPAPAENPFDDSTGWTRFDYSAGDGLKLAGRLYGAGNLDRLPVICLPGLTRNSADFHDLALHLSRHETAPRTVLALDYRGRGMSSRDKNWQNYNVLTEADDILAGATAAGIGEAVIVGTSRGALLAMALSAIRPGLIAAAVMNDAGPEIDGRGLVRIKSYVEKGADFRKWQEAVNAIALIGQSQFPDFSEQQWQKQARQIFEEKNGKILRRYDPALIKTLSEINLDIPLPTLWPQFAGLAKVPLLVVRGELSDLLSVETVKHMMARHARMELLTVPRQGHAPDLGTPGIPERIASFIEKAEVGHH
jgi:pimeloyl-ACP methyl ester carboxylesterase